MLLREAASTSHEGSDFQAAAVRTRRAVILDIDGTRTTGEEPTAEELGAREAICTIAEAYAAHGSATNRTGEMCRSSQTLLTSRYRPLPQLGINALGKRHYVPPETVPNCQGCLDPPLILSVATGIDWRHGNRYGYDSAHLARSMLWRHRLLDLLAELDRQGGKHPRLQPALADIESAEKYYAGETDVFVPPYRIQLEWRGEGAIENLSKAWRHLAFWLRVLGRKDTLIGKEIAKDRAALYLFPDGSAKEDLINYAIWRVGGIEECIYGGDREPDLRPGFEAALGAKRAFFILAGGSPLARHISPRGDRYCKPYAGENMHKWGSRLEKTSKDGFYRVRDEQQRIVIICDEIWPGFKGPFSVLRALQWIFS